MLKKFEVNYIQTFHVKAANKKEAGEIGDKALLDFLKNFAGNPYKDFYQEIIEL